MRIVTLQVIGVALGFAMSAQIGMISAQNQPSETQQPTRRVPASFVAQDPDPGSHEPTFFVFSSDFSLTPQPLLDLNDPDIKFDVNSLMNILRDRRHESWVLAAYPDPKTGRPLIGAGFSLDVSATEHIQRNPFNPHEFVEPSSAQLWQAAGLDLSRLQGILDHYDRDLRAWNRKTFRKKIRTHELSPELTEEEATRLLRISTREAIHNARAYCYDFDQLTASQQMGLTQLVFQMGVNLEEFVQFLSTMNDRSSDRDSVTVESSNQRQDQHWKTVQQTLIQSDWARRYTSRAVAVIAMFDPDYDKNPNAAERYVQSQIHPIIRSHRRVLIAKSNANGKQKVVSFSKAEHNTRKMAAGSRFRGLP